MSQIATALEDAEERASAEMERPASVRSQWIFKKAESLRIAEVVERFRKMGAVGFGFHPDGSIQSITFATPLVEPATESRGAVSEQALSKGERAQLNALRERYDMDQELGNA